MNRVNRKNSSGAGMFMMEMIAVVFFFILCASTCTLVFVKANSMSRLAKDINRSVIAAESVAEVWKAEGAYGLAARFDAAADTGTSDRSGESKVFWDRDWNASGGETEASYRTDVKWKEKDGIVQADIAVYRIADGELLFSMTAGRRGDGME